MNKILKIIIFLNLFLLLFYPLKSEEITDSVLYDNDIFITPGTIFGSQGEGYIRFSLCVESEVIKEAISRL